MNERSKQIEAFLGKLNTRKIVGWSEEFRIGKPLYERLLSAIKTGEMRSNQLANALIVVFRLRDHGSSSEVFDLMVASLTNPSKRVRDQAVRLIAGMQRIEGEQIAATTDVKTCLRQALSLGVTKDAEVLARTLIDEAAPGKPEKPSRG